MSVVRVYNDNVHPYREKFKDKMIDIPSKNFVIMDYDDAIIFRGRHNPVVLDGGGNANPESYKMIRIVEDSNEPVVPQKEKILCHACSKIFPTALALDMHITDSHAAMILDDTEREKRMKEKAAK